MKKLSLLLCTALLLSACASRKPPGPGTRPTHVWARDAVAAGKGFLEQAKKNHPECNPKNSAAQSNSICRALWTTIAVQNATVTLLITYCQSSAGWEQGALCQPVAQPQVEAALIEKVVQLEKALHEANP